MISTQISPPSPPLHPYCHCATSSFFLTSRMDSTHLTMALKSLQLLPVQACRPVHVPPLPHYPASTLSLPLLVLIYIRKELCVVSHTHPAISYLDASVELPHLCLLMPSFPRLTPTYSSRFSWNLSKQPCLLMTQGWVRFSP